MYQAEYKPVPISQKPINGCDLPVFTTGTLNLQDLSSFEAIVDCDLNFIPTPIVPQPYIPTLEVPCPDGFQFEAQFNSGSGNYFSQGALPPPGEATAVNITLNGITTDVLLGGYTDEHPLPQLEAKEILPNAVLNGLGMQKEWTLVAGEQYLVKVATGSPSTYGVAYNNKFYKHNQAFVVKTGKLIAATEPAQVADNIVRLWHVQRREVIKNVSSSQVTIDKGFTFSNNTNVSDFSFNRIGISSSSDKLSGGKIAFIQDTDGCGGKLVGNINFNIDDLALDIPCSEGFEFDAGWCPVNEPILKATLTFLKQDITGYQLFRIVRHNGETKTFAQLIPVLADGFTPRPPAPKIKFSNYPTTPEVESSVTVISLVDADTVQVSGTQNDTTGISDWCVERINVEVTSGPSGGGFKFYPNTDNCGGMLQGLISINTDNVDVDVPCKTALTNNTLVTNNTATNKSVLFYDLNDVTVYNGFTLPSRSSYATAITNVDKPTTCSYNVGLNGAVFSVPKIVINGTAGTFVDNGKTLSFTIPTNGGGGGTTPTTSTCANCCRWS